MTIVHSIERLDPVVVESLRRMTPAQRVRQAFGSNRLVRERLAAHFRRQHPDGNSDAVRKAVAERVLRGTA